MQRLHPRQSGPPGRILLIHELKQVPPPLQSLCIADPVFHRAPQPVPLADSLFPGFGYHSNNDTDLLEPVCWCTHLQFPKWLNVLKLNRRKR